MSSTSSASRICPVCDAPNSSISLFCAECGASLEPLDSGSTGSLNATSFTESASQATAALPLPTSAPQSSNPAPASSPPSWMNTGGETSVWEPVSVVPAPTIAPDRGMRGFYLGLIAVLLILAVLLTWGWAAILDDSSRSSISGFFDFIG